MMDSKGSVQVCKFVEFANYHSPYRMEFDGRRHSPFCYRCRKQIDVIGMVVNASKCSSLFNCVVRHKAECDWWKSTVFSPCIIRWQAYSHKLLRCRIRYPHLSLHRHFCF